MDGCRAWQKLTAASSNVSRNVFSDSPDIPETIDGADTLMKATPTSYNIRKALGHESHQKLTTHSCYSIR